MATYDTGKMMLFIQSILWDLHVPQEAATVLFEDNDSCTAIGNAQKSTPRTRHIDIKYFSLCKWVERNLMLLERIDTSINMSDHMTKGLRTILFHPHANFILGHIPPMFSTMYLMLLKRIDTSINMSDHMTKGFQTILFHCHDNFILGHVPPMYYPVYESIVGTYTNHTVDIDHYVPPTFTTPTTAAAARVHAPILSDYHYNPWIIAIDHGQYKSLFTSSSHSLCSHYISDSGLGGGDVG
jgi:hypothetical protein